MIPDATHNDCPPYAEREIANLIPPYPRIFICSGCGIDLMVRPARFGLHWHYRSKCQCGNLSSTLRKLQTKCPECEAVSLVDKFNPTGGCKSCSGPNPKSKGPYE